MPARRPAAQIAHAVERRHDALDARLAALVKEFALACERRAAGSAQEQAHFELRLELLHIAANRGAADAEAIARAGEAAFIGDGQE